LPRADAIVAAVAHKEYTAMSADEFCNKVAAGGAFIDVKSAFDLDSLQAAGFRVWRL